MGPFVWLQDPVHKGVLSQSLGYGSIACWLCAQFPQILANYRAGSCEGLALPFLLNWMAGDLTNLIGCLLTDQLEFQKLLATYFMFVDLILIGQFAYYIRKVKPEHGTIKISSQPCSPQANISYSPPTTLTSSSRRLYTRATGSYDEMSQAAAKVARAAEAVANSKRGGARRSRSRTRFKGGGRGESRVPVAAGVDGADDGGHVYGLENSIESLVSFASSSEQQPSHGGDTTTGPSTSRARSTRTRTRTSSSHRISFATADANTTRPSGLPPSSSTGTAALFDSPPTSPLNYGDDVSSSPRGRALTRPMFTLDVHPGTPEAHLVSTTATEAESHHHLHRHYHAQASQQQQEQPQELSPRRLRNPSLMRNDHPSRSQSRGGAGAISSSTTTGSRTAGVVLMSLVGALALRGIGPSIVRSGIALGRERDTPGGRVVWEMAAPPPPPPDFYSALSLSSSNEDASLVMFLDDPLPSLTERPSGVDAILSSSKHHDKPSTSAPSPSPSPPHHGYPPSGPIPWDRLLGRISAWTCTVLYLTSRMPQIWKNFTRKSVEGLSVLLFVFAFCANSLYVTSILLNPLIDQPRPASTEYILESLPYVLGSGGTLVFDLTLMAQFLLYGSSPPLPEDQVQPWQHPPPHHHHSHSHSYHDRPKQRASSRRHNTPSQSQSQQHGLRLRSSMDDLEAGLTAPLLGGGEGGWSTSPGHSPVVAGAGQQQQQQRASSRSTAGAAGRMRNPSAGGRSWSRGSSSRGGETLASSSGSTNVLGLRGTEEEGDLMDLNGGGEDLRRSVIIEQEEARSGR